MANIINSINSGGTKGFIFGENPTKIYSENTKVLASNWLNTTFPTSSTKICNGTSYAQMGITIGTNYDYVTVINYFVQYYYDSLSNVSGLVHPLWSGWTEFVIHASTPSTSSYLYNNGLYVSNIGDFPSISSYTQGTYGINRIVTSKFGGYNSYGYQLSGIVLADNTYKLCAGEGNTNSSISSSNYVGLFSSYSAPQSPIDNPETYMRCPSSFFNATAKTHIDLDKTFLIKKIDIYQIDKASSFISKISDGYRELYTDNYVPQT